MTPETEALSNLRQAVPFFMVRDMAASTRFYVDGLGFKMTNQWVVEGKVRWCWLELGDVALMLQELSNEDPRRTPNALLGTGVSICFVCRDALALYREFRSRGVEVKKPFVGNNMWVCSLTDPDGYHLDFESPTDAPEESEYEA